MNEAVLRPVRAVVLAVATGLAVVAAVPAQAASGDGSCPNAPVRAQQSATHLPDCGAYEKVTPGGKGAGAVQPSEGFQVAPDGESVLYGTTAPFESVPTASAPAFVTYFARRGAAGWTSRSLDPPFDFGPGAGTAVHYVRGVFGLSQNLRYALIATADALVPGAIPDGSNIYRRDTHTGAVTLLASSTEKITSIQSFNAIYGGLNAKFIANDGKTFVFAVPPSFLAGEPLGSETTTLLVRWTEGSGLETVSVLPAAEGGGPTLLGTAGNDSYTPNGTRDSIPRSQGQIQRFAFSGFGPEAPVYLRDGNQTRVISMTRLTGTPPVAVPALVRAVSDAGRFVLLSTLSGLRARLTDDTPSGFDGKLYLYDSELDTLKYIGGLGEAFNETVTQMSHDGRSIAFQSPVALVPGAVEGRVNIYFWRDGQLKLVAVPDAGSAVDRNMGETHALMDEGGRYLAFTDDSASLAQSFGFDNESPACATNGAPSGLCMQMYRFDADAPAESALRCASCRTDGGVAGGPSGDPAKAGPGGGTMFTNSHHQQIVTTDGTVLFTSADDISPEDNNGDHDAYAWRDGELWLLSRARLGVRSRYVDSSLDGGTVLISTSDRISPTDTDLAVDLYAIRSGGGYLETPPTPPAECLGADCRTPIAGPPVAPLVGSVGFMGGGNGSASPDRVRIAVSKFKTAPGVTARLRVRVPGAGRVSVAGRLIRRASVTAAKAGSYTVRVVLTKRAKKSLTKNKTLKVGVRVSYRLEQGQSARKTVKLTFKRKGGR
jgi:hypothetical protein